jgi:hypothetical protein
MLYICIAVDMLLGFEEVARRGGFVHKQIDV